jgi:hypothetical protein
MRALIAAGLVFGLVGLTTAQDKKNDPTGTWKYSVERNGQKFESTLKLKLEGDKVTGTVTGGRGGKGGGGGKGGTDTKIEDGKFKDGEVTFTVTRERGDTKITSTYKAKVDGDTMKGTMESKFGEKDTKTEFEAKREKVKD